MRKSNSDIDSFQAVAQQSPSYKWYVIADSAQHQALPAVLVESISGVKCIFEVSQGSRIAAKAPHLVEMPPPDELQKTWRWIALNARSSPCVTVIASPASFSEIYEHLVVFKDVILPDQSEMFLSFWDPAVLGTLVGNPQDNTLFIKGPVLDKGQRSDFMEKIAAWWYWDRSGRLQMIAGGSNRRLIIPSPFRLNQQQADELVEAGVPDHVIYHIEQNHPQIIEIISAAERYSLVCKALNAARSIGLSSMRDLLNFSCATLLYKERMEVDPEILDLLKKVKRGEMSFYQAVQEFPELSL